MLKAKKGGKRKKSSSDGEGEMGGLYSEIAIWSISYISWKKLRVRKARLPNDDDNDIRWNDMTRNRPLSLTGYQGNHNQEIIKSLKDYLDEFASEKRDIPSSIVIHGPSGSGKSALVFTFLSQMIHEIKLKDDRVSKWILRINCNDWYGNNGQMNKTKELWEKLSKFAEPAIEKFIPTVFRVIVMDNYDAIPSSAQTPFKKLFETAFRVRFIFTLHNVQDINPIVAAKSVLLKTNKIKEKDALQVILGLCFRNRIGYDREGIKTLFTYHAPDYSLSSMIDNIQKIFQQKYFIDNENVCTVLEIVQPKITIPSTRAMEPLERCRICTLFPPCKHKTTQWLSDQGKKRREQLPRYKGGLACPEWVRFGRCSIFSRYGHCSCDHPKNLHIIQYPEARCPTCTIKWPCNHCTYSKDRMAVVKVLEQLQEKFDRLRTYIQPDLGINETERLSGINGNWKSKLFMFEAMYVKGKDKIELLHDVKTWLDTAYSTDPEEYQNQAKKIKLGFGEIFRSDLLVDPNQIDLEAEWLDALGEVRSSSRGRSRSKQGSRAQKRAASKEEKKDI